MSTEIEKVDTATALASLPDLGAPQYGAPEHFDQLVRASFLSRVTLCTGNNKLITAGHMGAGKYALVRGEDDFVDLGVSLDCIPLARRYAAMDFSGEKPVIDHNPESETFKEIVTRSKTDNSQCQYGVQFLLWVPQVKEFSTFFFGSTSSRPEARKMDQRMKAPVTMKAKLVKTPKFQWHVPVILPCSAQLEPPPAGPYLTIGQQFLNPDQDKDEGLPEAATPAADAGRPR